ncbi:MAG: ABC transporter ATP-binding protein [Deltaproteobacteria bacterium]|jgi:iron(III) transport system ATP-binding protein|nr:ABC transporter ATP-binding protein [Deltaproteobacteria bacterium]
MFLEIDGLYFAYPGARSAWVLEDLGLRLEAGESVGLAGPSGQGKSTLLRLIAGLERPGRGSIRIDGKLVADEGFSLNPEEREVGLVFQDYGLFPHMTVAANIAYGLFRLNRTERRNRVDLMLELTRMGELAARHPYELSGGQQQRVALARALAPTPKLLLLDEPLSNIDAMLKADIRQEIRALLRQTDTTSLFVSHDLDDLKVVCDRIEYLGMDL